MGSNPTRACPRLDGIVDSVRKFYPSVNSDNRPTPRIAKSLSRQIFTLPNAISLGRLWLLLPLFVFLHHGGDDNMWALVVMGVALLTDMLDGLIARWLHQESEWGKVLDPVADKAWIGFLSLFLAMPWREHQLPWQFLVLTLSRDIAILIAGYFAYRRLGVVLPANLLGKVTMVVVAITLISYTIYWTPEILPIPLPEILLWIATVMILLSGYSYIRRYRVIIQEMESHDSVSV
jgi:CDP-diacylglycerol--glycerol-3-phosphate 3-phosphatidyltransferase